MEYRERRGFSSPINVGETYDVTIEDVGREGDGITRVEGFVVFVPNTKKGDSVKVRITKVSRRVGFAEVVA
jgi:predicted RNA-binding protein with TRAM domain